MEISFIAETAAYGCKVEVDVSSLQDVKNKGRPAANFESIDRKSVV